MKRVNFDKWPVDGPRVAVGFFGRSQMEFFCRVFFVTYSVRQRSRFYGLAGGQYNAFELRLLLTRKREIERMRGARRCINLTDFDGIHTHTQREKERERGRIGLLVMPLRSRELITIYED